MEKYPVPTHLKDIMDIDESCSDMHNIEGAIVCTCGCERFILMQNEDQDRRNSLRYGEWDGVKINAVCEKCGTTWLLFDQATQGYDGFVCCDYKSAPDEKLTPLKCRKCGKKVFGVRLSIEVEDREQFIEECVTEYPERFSPEDFVDSFDWITVEVLCAECKHRDEWISLELS